MRSAVKNVKNHELIALLMLVINRVIRAEIVPIVIAEKILRFNVHVEI